MPTCRGPVRIVLFVLLWSVIVNARWLWAEQNGSVVTGAMLYHTHCESCHGSQGRGDGMVGAALRTPPTDLSLLSQKHGGVFPDAAVRDFIDGERDVLAHGPRTMPVWGRIFQGKETIDKLVDHIRSLQRM